MISTTTTIYPQDGLQIQRSAWEAMMLNYLLLPALCGVFLFVIVLIIAFVFIKKKSGVSDVCPEKSCHTIESFNEVSDVSIYDVINEAHPTGEAHVHTASTTSSERKQDQVQNSKNRGLYSLASCLGVRESFSCKTIVLQSVTTVTTPESDSVHLPTGPSTKRSDEESLRFSTASNLQLDGRVYETLDRHWKAKGGRSLMTGGCQEHNIVLDPQDFPSSNLLAYDRLNPTGRSAIQNRARGEHIRCCPEHSTELPDAASVPLSLEEGIDTLVGNKTLKSTGGSIARPEVNDSGKRDFFPKTPNGQTICKLSFIPFSEASTHTGHNQAKNFYYLIQNKDNTEISVTKDDEYVSLPPTTSVRLHFSANPDDDKRLHDKNEKAHSLNLKPLTNTDLIGLFEEGTSGENSSKVIDSKYSGDQPHLFEAVKAKQSSKKSSCKKRLLKKSESFSETGADKPSESVRKFSLGAISFRQNAKTSADGKQQFEKMDKHEVARILSKLGPLPPIPRSSVYDATKSTNLLTTDCDPDASPKDLIRSKGHNSGFSTSDDSSEPKILSCRTCINLQSVEKEEHAPCAFVSASHDMMTLPHQCARSTHHLAVTNNLMLCHSPTTADDVMNETSTAKSPNHYFILESGKESTRNSCSLEWDGPVSEIIENVGYEKDTDSDED